jgi:hypothetical protein
METIFRNLKLLKGKFRKILKCAYFLNFYLKNIQSDSPHNKL